MESCSNRVSVYGLSLGLFLAASVASGTDIKGVTLGSSLDEAKAVLPDFVCHPGGLSGKYCITGVTYGNEHGADLTILLLNNAVGGILVSGPNWNWTAIRSGLIEKYGKPSSAETPTVTTGAGARLRSETLRWHLGGDEIQGDMHVSADKYGVSAYSAAWLAEKKRRARKPGNDM